MARTPRKWTGARTPSGLKRVRSAERRHEILQPRRTAAKSLVRKALVVATANTDGADPQVSLAEAMSALDRAAKVGAIHPNAAARRKSRLARKVAAVLGGTHVTAGRATKTTGTAAAQKAARARIAAGKAAKAKGAQTAAGKARAALSKTARAEAEAQARASAATAEGGSAGASKPATKSATRTPARSTAAKTTATKAPTTRASAATKPAAGKTAADKPAAKPTTRASSKKTS